MSAPSSVREAAAGLLERFPRSMTILTTYRCNAACRECCFESNPRRRGRLSRAEMTERIEEAVQSFPGLRLVVWSGGECFLHGEDLFAAVAYASARGLLTRCVTNGFWGRREPLRHENVSRLVEAGLSEINFSTGVEHQEWVPVESVLAAAEACCEAGITTVLTVEKDTPQSECYERVWGDARVQRMLGHAERRFLLQRNSWMPFHRDALPRGEQIDPKQIDKPCDQILHNVVITPSQAVSACCGLTFEYIPELILGRAGDQPLLELWRSQLDDFLKIWIHVDGPVRIVKKLLGDEADALLADTVHICQACVVMHQNERIRAALERRWREFAPDVLHRFFLDVAFQERTTSGAPHTALEELPWE